MNNQAEQHPSEWIVAYHDGELHGERLARVESHLAQCPLCLAELQNLQALSGLIRSVPAPAYRAAPNRFVASVMLQLPRTPAKPWPRRALQTAWKLAPAGIVAAWAFLQAALLVAGVSLTLFSGALPAFGGGPLRLLTAFDLFSPLYSLGGWSGVIMPAVEFFIIEAALVVLLAVLLWGWLASWWAVRSKV